MSKFTQQIEEGRQSIKVYQIYETFKPGKLSTECEEATQSHDCAQDQGGRETLYEEIGHVVKRELDVLANKVEYS